MKNTSQDTAFFQSGYSEVNGIKMYYELHGNKGDYLVLMHGGGSTIGTTFGKIMPLLAKTHKIIAVEMQGHGHTSDREAPESFEQDADDVAALLKNLSIPKASFFGFSNGGNTTIQIAVRHPDLIDKLILASTFYKKEGFPDGFFEGMLHAKLNDMPASLRNAFLEITPDSTKLLSMFNKDRMRMIDFKDWSDEMIKSITASTLIIDGVQDVVKPEHAMAMYRLMPNAQLIILPGAHGEFLGEIETKYDSNFVSATALLINRFLLE